MSRLQDMKEPLLVSGCFLLLGFVVCAFIYEIDYKANERYEIYEQRELADRLEFCKGKTVLEVGGCTGAGKCRVKLSSGELTEMYLPIKGMDCY